MVSRLEELRTRLTADTDDFDRGMDNVDDRLSGVDETLDQLGVGASNFTRFLSGPGGVVAGVTAAAVAIGTATARFAEWNRELNFGARVAGILPSQYLAIEQAFARVGGEGISLRDLFNDLNERVEDAEFADTYSDAFDRLGLSWRSLRELDPTERLLAVTEALRGLDTEAQQLFVNEIFGGGLESQSILALIRSDSDDLASALDNASGSFDNLSQSVEEGRRFLTTLEQGFTNEFLGRLGRGVALFQALSFVVTESNVTANLRGLAETYGLLNDELAETPANPGFQAILRDLNLQDAMRAADAEANARRRVEASREEAEQGLEILAGEEARVRRLIELNRFFTREAIRGIRERERARIENEDLIDLSLDRSAEMVTTDLDSLIESLDERIAGHQFEFDIPTEPISRFQEALIAAGPDIARFFSDIIRGGGEAEDVLLGLVSLILQLGVGNLQAGRGFFQFGGARQFGGPVFPDRAYVVGERGPELFVPDLAGRVEPSGAGGTTVIIEAGPNAAAVRQVIREELPDAETRFITNVRREIDTPGTQLNRSVRRESRS